MKFSYVQTSMNINHFEVEKLHAKLHAKLRATLCAETGGRNMETFKSSQLATAGPSNTKTSVGNFGYVCLRGANGEGSKTVVFKIRTRQSLYCNTDYCHWMKPESRNRSTNTCKVGLLAGVGGAFQVVLPRASWAVRHLVWAGAFLVGWL